MRMQKEKGILLYLIGKCRPVLDLSQTCSTDAFHRDSFGADRCDMYDMDTKDI